MAYTRQEEIIGYYVQGQVVCTDCVTDEKRKGKFTAKGVITKEGVTEGDFCFCNRCGDDVRDSADWLERMREGSLNRERNENLVPNTFSQGN